MKLKNVYTLEALTRELSKSLIESIFHEYNTAPESVHADGQIHRFDIDRKGDKVGWYVLYEDNDFSCAVFGNWRLGDSHKWQSIDTLTDEQKYRLEVHMQDFEDSQRSQHEDVARQATSIYENALTADESHPYLERKQVGTDTYLAQIRDCLVLPLLDGELNITSLQYIYPDGRKQFLKGGRTSGCFCPIGLTEDYKGPVYMAEGYATAKSIQEATGRPCIVAFNAGNLPKVAESLKDLWDITVVADNDESGTGEKYAKATGLPYKLIPRVGMDANDYATAGYDLKEFLEPTSQMECGWLVSASDFMDSYKPSSWLIKNWIPRNAQVMVYGDPGCGKSFITMDMLLSITTGQATWFTCKVRKGNAVYLAGEGHDGIRKRLKVWSQERGITDLGNLMIAQSALDLDTPQGLQEAADRISELSWKPDIIAIDTLNRFYSGDENSSQEMRGFIESCSELQRLFSCTILIVHHTGVSSDAKMRGRGSSALKGALDSEILVMKDEDNLITLKQTKQKDIDVMPDMNLVLKGHVIRGWFDEDGEPLTSATVEKPGEEDRKKALDDEVQILIEAWSQSEHIHDSDDYPLLMRGDIRAVLKSHHRKETDIKNWFKTDKSRPLGKLLDVGILKASADGWSVRDLDIVNLMMLEEMG